VERIRRTATGRGVVTTAKDAGKLAGRLRDLQVWVLEQTVVVEEGGSELASLLNGLGRR
jgi:hypothetical protein